MDTQDLEIYWDRTSTNSGKVKTVEIMQVPSIVLRGNACYKDAKIILDILNSVSRMEQK